MKHKPTIPLALYKRSAFSDLANRCTQLHYDLMAAGLFETGHRMHEVVRSAGFEMARIGEKLDREADRKVQAAAKARRKRV